VQHVQALHQHLVVLVIMAILNILIQMFKNVDYLARTELLLNLSLGGANLVIMNAILAQLVYQAIAFPAFIQNYY